MIIGIVAAIVEMRLNPGKIGDMRYKDVNSAQEWLAQWTCANNIKQVLAEDLTEAVDKLRDNQVTDFLLFQNNPMLGYKASDFQFRVATSEVDMPSGHFWPPNTSNGQWYDIIVENSA